MEQSRDAVDKGLHAGGAFPAVIPLVTLYYGGFVTPDVEDRGKRYGFAVAQGFAIAGRFGRRFDSYALLGDGELQEGPIWEAVMYAGAKHLDNLCILVDRNHGQLDIFSRLIFPMPDLGPVFESFGWQSHTVDATK